GREAVGDLALHVGVEVVGVDRVAADLHPELLVEVAGVVVGAAAAAGEGEGGACGEGGGEGVTGLHGVSPVRRGDIQVRRWSVVGGSGRRFSCLRRRRARRSRWRPPAGTRRRARRSCTPARRSPPSRRSRSRRRPPRRPGSSCSPSRRSWPPLASARFASTPERSISYEPIEPSNSRENTPLMLTVAAVVSAATGAIRVRFSELLDGLSSRES